MDVNDVKVLMEGYGLVGVSTFGIYVAKFAVTSRGVKLLSQLLPCGQGQFFERVEQVAPSARQTQTQI